jgi:hypothetical protein
MIGLSLLSTLLIDSLSMTAVSECHHKTSLMVTLTQNDHRQGVD